MYVQKADQKDTACLVAFKIILTLITFGIFALDMMIMLDLLPWGDLTNQIQNKPATASGINVRFPNDLTWNQLQNATYKGKFFKYPIKLKMMQAIEPAKFQNFSIYFYNEQQFNNFKRYNLSQSALEDQSGYVNYCHQKLNMDTNLVQTDGDCGCFNSKVLTMAEGVLQPCWIKMMYDTRQTEMEYAVIIIGIAVAVNLAFLAILVVVWIKCHSKFGGEGEAIKKQKAANLFTSSNHTYE